MYRELYKLQRTDLSVRCGPQDDFGHGGRSSSNCALALEQAKAEGVATNRARTGFPWMIAPALKRNSRWRLHARMNPCSSTLDAEVIVIRETYKLQGMKSCPDKILSR